MSPDDKKGELNRWQGIAVKALNDCRNRSGPAPTFDGLAHAVARALYSEFAPSAVADTVPGAVLIPSELMERVRHQCYPDTKREIEAAMDKSIAARSSEPLDDVEAMHRARHLWHRQCGLDGRPCPTERECEVFNLGFKASLLHIAAHSAMGPSWQHISTAPKDGTEVLLAEHGENGYGEIDAGHWGFIEKSDWDGSDVIGWLSNYGRVNEPTHWMPMPGTPRPPDSLAKHG